MPNYEALAAHKNQLIRKALSGSLFIAPESAAAIVSLTSGATGELQVLPDGYVDAGNLANAGIQFKRSVDTSDVSSLGAYEPTRSDVTKDTVNFEVPLQETNKLTIALFTGADLDALVPDTTTGELIIPKPSTPSTRFWRALALAVDETDAGEIYVARFFPRAQVTDYTDQAYAKGDDPILWGVTMSAKKDSTLGYSQVDLFGGPGWKALLTDMGFAAVP